ncbi:MAG: mannose-1-phosphate guanylyltransferase [Candidatus Saccharimonadales bacterium]
MIVVIIAGGSGTRLWPLSTPDYPKHLLKINGDDKSLLQNTYDRAKYLTDKIYVVPETSHAHHVKEQLPELSDDCFIIEPARRGTASCIVASLSHIASRHDHNETIVFLSSDHYIRDQEGFVHSFIIASEVSENEQSIVLVGVEPDYPATGFGYIQKGELIDEDKFVFNVHSFKEKPDFDTAKEYLKSGNYLWNCGYFVGSLDVFEKNMKEHSTGMFDNYQKLKKTATMGEYEDVYLSFENTTIDYELIEKVNDLLVVPASFDWLDLGSFGDLHKAVDSDEKGNHLFGKTIELSAVENSFIQNYEDKPLAVVGLDNIVVINTKRGILVARKDLAQQVGEVSKRFKKD